MLRAQAGDRDALETLLAGVQGPLYRYLQHLTNDADLAESMVKRELGVKDMSSILPGHGGVMDRLDSIVFASPVVFVLYGLVAGA